MSTDPFEFDIEAFMAEVEEAAQGATPETLAKLIPKIKKLLNKAENAGTPAEADAFNEKAARLIAKYGIDALMLDSDKPEQDRKIGNRWIRVPGPYMQDRSVLLWVLVHAFGAQLVYFDSAGVRTHHVFGAESDLVRIELLFQSLLIQMQRELDRALWAPRVDGTTKSVFSRNFMAGYQHIVKQRLTQSEGQARATAETDRGEKPGTQSTSVALALYDRNAAVTKAMQDVYPNTTKARRRKARSGAGVRAGMDAGQRANLGGNDLTSQPQAAGELQ